MIAPPSNTQIWIAAGVTDLRRGFTGLSALQTLQQDPQQHRIGTALYPYLRMLQLNVNRSRRGW
jgi:hypothetical protein